MCQWVNTGDALPDLFIPSNADVKRITVWSSSLPGVNRKSFTIGNDKTTILKVLNWLRHAQVVGREKPPLGLGGYPPGMSITTNSGKMITIDPATNWKMKKLSNGNISISGKYVVGYVSFKEGANSKRLYSPDLYNCFCPPVMTES